MTAGNDVHYHKHYGYPMANVHDQHGYPVKLEMKASAKLLHNFYILCIVK